MKRIGSSCLLLAIGSACGILAADAAQKKAEPYALVAGTVFRDTGFALPGAEVTVSPDPPAGTNSKIKKQKALTNFRGEFTFRLPATAMRYHVSVKAAGYRTQVKSVTISGDERVDLSFLLDPEKGGGS